MFYFIGIKGTGMAALAVLLNDLGNEVSGCDLEKHFFTENLLNEKGIKIETFETAAINENSTVIVGNAFSDDFKTVIQARNTKGVKIYRYHEYLGKLMENYKTICVSGSHGKTTTTGILASMLKHKNAGYIIGDGTGYISKESEYFCVEADEYRRHFLMYYPKYSIITNVDLDHVDYFKDDDDYNLAYEQFCNQSEINIIFGDDIKSRSIKTNSKLYYYGINNDNDFVARNIVETNKDMSFDVYFNNEFIYRFNLPFVGRHLLWNSLAVISVGILEGIDLKEIENGISEFKGVKRRFVIEEINENVYIDDYAHHPTEVSITIDAARKRYPDRKIVSIFKPHRVSRVFKFAKEFAQALNKSDAVYLCDFTSIDDKEEGIDIDINYLKDMIPNSKIIGEKEEDIIELDKNKPAVFLFMSSKDIYHIANKLKRYQKN